MTLKEPISLWSDEAVEVQLFFLPWKIMADQPIDQQTDMKIHRKATFPLLIQNTPCYQLHM